MCLTRTLTGAQRVRVQQWGVGGVPSGTRVARYAG